MMNFRALLMALPIAAISIPATATNVAGSYDVTLTNVRPGSLNGSQSCFTLTQTGDVMGWADSGTFTMTGGISGEYYAIQGVLTAFAPVDSGNGELVLTGKLHLGNIMTTSYLELDNGQTAITGQFSATSVPSC